MNTLSIPYLPDLERMTEEVLVSTLGKEGAFGKIDNAPWPEFPYRPEASFRVAVSQEYLFIKFNVKGLGLKAEFTETNQPVWQDSCVEFFVADPDGCAYHNFEINCIGTLLSARQSAKGVDVTPISEEDAGKIIRITSLEREKFSEKEGEFEWSVTAGIPWRLMGYEACPEIIRANFYKCADGSSRPHYLCWSPIETPEPDFHRPEYFGELKIETP